MKRILSLAVTCAAVLSQAPWAFAQEQQPAPSAVRGRSLFGRSLLNNRPGEAPATAQTQQQPQGGGQSQSAQTAVESGGRSIEFNGAPVEMVLKVYGDLVDKTILKDPAAPSATITLQPKQGQELSNEEKILAIETVLEMNGIHLEPYGEKFMRALPRQGARKEGIPLIMDPDAPLDETSRVVSMMLTFRNIPLDEAQKAIESLKSDKAAVNVYERSNSILVTDTEMNIARMRDILKEIDIPTPVTENVFIRQIQNANAADIQKVLQAIVEDAKKILEKQGKQAQNATRQSQQPAQPFTARLLGGRPAQNAPAAPKANESVVTSVSDADRGMIRGDSLIIADERSNKLIIKTLKSNMDFFDKIIEQLDVETTPDTVVKVYRLKYAECEDVADMINDLIGNAASSKSSSKGSQNANSKQAGGQKSNVTTGTSQKKSVNQRTGEAKTGELSKENTTILADKRINGIVVMTNKELVPVLEQIIESMDIKLSQVLIETVIIEVSLNDDLKTGIDWVHGMQRKGSSYRQALGGGGGSATPTASGAAGSKLIDGVDTALPTIFAPGTAGLSYALFSEKLDLSAVISASKSDTHSKYIASPIVMTVDNKEATIDATENRQFLTGWTAQSSGYSGGGQPTPNYSAKDIGLKLKITPKINPNGTVMLTVEEEYSQFMENAQSMLIPQTDSSGRINYNSGNVDLAIERKMSADILLENMQSVVLGGLTETKVEESDVGIPILKDIPWVGRWLFGKTVQGENRKELLVFLTPYVLDDSQAAQVEALRRKNVMSDARPWDDHGWSKSELADPVTPKEKLRKQKELWQKQDEDYESEKAMDKARKERALKLRERAVEDVKDDVKTEETSSGEGNGNAENKSVDAEKMDAPMREFAKGLQR